MFSVCICRVLHEGIHWSLGAFADDRQILDVVLVVNEVVGKRCFGKSRVAFVIDFGKSHDHVN